MGTDDELMFTLKKWQETNQTALIKERTPDEGGKAALSLSGKERNRLFVSHRAERFADVSGLSGLDSPADGRVFVLWDFNRDGAQDIAHVNANFPLLSAYENRLATGQERNGNLIALRFEGGNRKAAPSRQFSSRDGYGVQVRVTLDDDTTLLREFRSSEGLAAQNSATMLIGIGARAAARGVSVQWPSGRRQKVGEVPAGELVTIYEQPKHAPNGEAFQREPYVRAFSERPSAARAGGKALQLGLEAAPDGAKLNVYTTMATWCVACKRHQPQLEALRAGFEATEVALFGVPADKEDTPAMLATYVEQNTPPYRLLADMPPADVERVKSAVRLMTASEGLPSTVVTDADGTILLAVTGVPASADLRRLLQHVAARD